MELSQIRITLRQAIWAGALLLTLSGGYYTLQAQVSDNVQKIDRIEARSVADSNRIRQIKEEAVRAKTEREFIREKVKENGAKLDAILDALRRPQLQNSP